MQPGRGLERMQKKTSQKIIFENIYGNYNVVPVTNYQDNSLILKNGNITTTEYNFCIYTYRVNKHSVINLYTYWRYGLDKTRYLAVGLYNGDTFVKGIEIVKGDQIDLTTSILNDEADTIKVLCSNTDEAPLIYQKDICVYDKNEDDLFAWKDKIDDDNVFVKKLSPDSIQTGKIISHKTGEYITNDDYDTVIYKIPVNEYLIENSLVRVKTDIRFGVNNDYNIISLYSNGMYLNNRSLTGQSIDIVYHKAIFLANADEIRVTCKTGYLPTVEIGESFDYSKEFFFKKEKISFTDYYENTLIRTNGSISSYNNYCICKFPINHDCLLDIHTNIRYAVATNYAVVSLWKDDEFIGTVFQAEADVTTYNKTFFINSENANNVRVLTRKEYTNELCVYTHGFEIFKKGSSTTISSDLSKQVVLPKRVYSIAYNGNIINFVNRLYKEGILLSDINKFAINSQPCVILDTVETSDSDVTVTLTGEGYSDTNATIKVIKSDAAALKNKTVNIMCIGDSLTDQKYPALCDFITKVYNDGLGNINVIYI